MAKQFKNLKCKKTTSNSQHPKIKNQKPTIHKSKIENSKIQNPKSKIQSRAPQISGGLHRRRAAGEPCRPSAGRRVPRWEKEKLRSATKALQIKFCDESSETKVPKPKL